MITDEQKRILDDLTGEIVRCSWSCAHEQHDPRPDPDQSDGIISERKAQRHELRRIREQLEDIFSGIV